MIRLAPRLAAARHEIGRGIALHLELVTPAAFAASAADLLSRLPAEVSDDEKQRIALDVGLEHFCVEIEDHAGERHPYSDEAFASIVAQDRRLWWAARAAMNQHLSGANLAAAEGNGSAPSADGGPGAG